MLLGELAQGVEDVSLNLLRGLLRVQGRMVNNERREVRAVHRVVHGDGELELTAIVDRRASDTGPHRLMDDDLQLQRGKRGGWNSQ